MTRIRVTSGALSALREGLDVRIARSVGQGAQPLSSAYSVEAGAILHDQADRLWRSVRAVFEGLDEVSALQQAWSTAHHVPLWRGLLFDGAVRSGSAKLGDEARRLRRLSRSALRAGAPNHGTRFVSTELFGHWLLSEDANKPVPVPDFGVITKLPGSLRLRFHLAHHLLRGESLAALLKRAATQPGPSNFVRVSEFLQALGAIKRIRKSHALVRPTDIIFLGDRELRFLHDLKPHWPDLLSPAIAGSADPATRIEALIAERDRLLKVFSEIGKALVARAFPAVDGLVESVGRGVVVNALAKRLTFDQTALQSNRQHPAVNPDWGVWQPLTATSLGKLKAWYRKELPTWWAMTPARVHEALISRTLIPDPAKSALSSFCIQDLLPIQRGFTDEQSLSLIRAGFGHFAPQDSAAWNAVDLDELTVLAAAHKPVVYLRVLGSRLQCLPDARPWLQKMATGDALALQTLAASAIRTRMILPAGADEPSKPRVTNWEMFSATAVGTPEWLSVEAAATHDTFPLLQAIRLHESGRPPIDAEAQRMAVARSLNQPDLRPPRPLMVCLRWLEFDAAALYALVRHGPAPLLSRLAANRATPKGVLDALVGCDDKSLQRVALRARLRRASTGGDLLQIAEHPLAGKVGLGWQQSWGDFTDDMRDLACVMAVRCSGEGLSRLAGVIGDAAFDQALSKAIAHLERTSASDAARLELVRALGVTSAPMLLRALASVRYDAASGHRLDHAYHVFERPKRSGGIRHISNPSVALKATQRAVLLGLLKPLGAHEAAFGFVPGRSIVDNAGPHQRKPIVVNADVSNCFPSVRWPLVLAALRRHLSERLSPRAISLLVDLCTAQGGLPIGAPTSPALLNLVLWKTDEVLSQAAQSRGVTYSRYADDLTFSGDERAIGMLGIARRTLSQIGLALDPKKTNVFRRGRRQVVTGLVVNDQVSVPRAIRRRLRAAVHRSSAGLEPHWEGALDSKEALAGRIAFVRMVHPMEGQALQKKLQGGKA